MRRFYAALICMILSIQVFMLSGCAKQQSQSKAMGRYIENEISLDEVLGEKGQFVVQLKNGELQVFSYGYEGTECYTLGENLGLKKEATDWTKAFDELICKRTDIYIQAMGVDEEDNYYAACLGNVEGDECEHDPQKTRNYIAKMQEGKMQLIELKIEDTLPYVIPNHLSVLENGDYILGTEYGNIMQFNASGEWIRNYGTTTNEKFAIDGGQILRINA